MMGLPDGEKSLDGMFTHFDRMYERDGHTHRQTDTTLRQNAGQRPRLMQASRGKNEVEGV